VIEMNLQNLVDGMNAQLQRERSETQMTLGKLIAELEAMPEGAEVANLNGMHSYRGYYTDLAFEQGEGMRAANELLAECKSAIGQVFEGYKGGDYVMDSTTPLWIAHYGICGEKLMALHIAERLKQPKMIKFK
jgi:hypothetical protein